MFTTKAKDMEDMVEIAVIMKSRLNIMEVEEMVNIENLQTSPEQEAKIIEKKKCLKSSKFYAHFCIIKIKNDENLVLLLRHDKTLLTQLLSRT